ncbi:MAG: argininosuccinate lyase [Dehalococcoidia bacterium]|nr:argininosuccinate lyase [Dehalococcoidia bacterium]
MSTDPSSYTVSIQYDRRLYRQDIAGSIAHARMLGKQGIITEGEALNIVEGLEQIRTEIEEGSFPWRPELEDIHMNVERRLHEVIGTETAGKLHTARSRNDQISVDMRLYLREVVGETVGKVRGLQGALLELAESNPELIIPGYTHVQRAQPVLFAHHLLAYFHMLQRDIRRFEYCHEGADALPLGSGALAGVPYPVDRQFLATELGFSKTTSNSMDAVSDRDFVVEYHSAAAMCMMHLSRLAEELVLWSSQEFGYVTLSEEYVTGSSIMPQKRNPDYAELARGKTGRVYGHLMAILTVLKGLPLAYNRDLQEDKEGLFDTVDTLLATLEVFRGMINTMQVNAESLSKAAAQGQMLATDLADYLVTRKGVPFREAHGVVARLSSYAISRNVDLMDLTLEEYQKHSPAFDEEVFSVTAESSVAARDVQGGTAPQQVSRALLEARKLLGQAGEE